MALVLIPTKTFPQDRSLPGTLVGALDRILLQAALRPDALVFLDRAEDRPSDQNYIDFVGSRASTSTSLPTPRRRATSRTRCSQVP